MTIFEFSQALDQGKATFADLMAHVKRGDFTLEDFNDFGQRRRSIEIEELIKDFYEGGLFKAQHCDFVNWCNGSDLYHDKPIAKKCEDLFKKSNRAEVEICNYIAKMIHRKRLPISAFNSDEKDQGARQAIFEDWNRVIDNNGWRSWPKQRG